MQPNSMIFKSANNRKEKKIRKLHSGLGRVGVHCHAKSYSSRMQASLHELESCTICCIGGIYESVEMLGGRGGIETIP